MLMSTHYIDEAERLADSVTIMAEGSAVAVGSPADLVAEHAGREVAEIYGPPTTLREAEASAHADGFATRRTGTSVAVLGAERARSQNGNGGVPSGSHVVRRPANLEDVFVKLTGEEVE